MSFTEVLQELPALTFEQRQLLIRRAVELDDPPLSDADESLVESRLSALRDAPALQSNERNLSLIINTIPTHIYVLNTEGSVQCVNQAVMEYTGLSMEDVQQEDYRDRVIHPEDFKRVRAPRAAGLRRGAPFSTEQRVLGNDGQYRWFLVRYKPLLDEQGRIVRWYVAAFDIEDRKQAEDALQVSERNLRQVIDTIPTLIHVLGPGGSVLYVNPRVLDYTGLTLEDVQRGDYRDRVGHPEDAKKSLRERRAQALTSAVPFESEYRVLGKDGQYRWFLARYNPLLDDQGKVDRWYVTATDIDDRKRAEDALARQAAVRADVSAAFSKPVHLQEILRGCTEAIVRHLDAAFARIWLLNKDESVLELQASAGMYTRLDGSYSRIPVGDLKVGLIAREKKAHFTNDLLNDPRVNDKRWARDNGMVAFAGNPLVVEDRLIGVVALFARHTLAESIPDTLASVADTIAQGIERKRAEEELQQLVDLVPQLIAVVAPDGKFIYANKVSREYASLPLEEFRSVDVIGRLVHPDDLEKARAERKVGLAGIDPFEYEARMLGKDGIYRWFLIRYNPLVEAGRARKWYATATEIESRKQEEDRVRQENVRLEERTRIAQELHDTLLQSFNAATMKLAATMYGLPSDSPLKPNIDPILDLMEQGIAEGRTAIQGLRACDCGTPDLVAALSGVRREFVVPPDMDFRVSVVGSQKPLQAPIGQELYRIGKEALVNAFRHSRARRVDLELEYADSHLTIRVCDNGCGIDPLVLEKGLDGHWGLAGIRERAVRLGGQLDISSAATAGTEIRLSIPGDVAFQMASSRRDIP